MVQRAFDDWMQNRRRRLLLNQRCALIVLFRPLMEPPFMGSFHLWCLHQGVQGLRLKPVYGFWRGCGSCNGGITEEAATSVGLRES
jgi:hypothetical protein